MRSIIFISCMCFIALFGWTVPAYAFSSGRGFDFSAYEVTGLDYTFPAFKFSVRIPDGSILGWDKNTGQWTGKITESVVNNDSFDYPEWGNSCTSKEPIITREINMPNVDIKGEYVIWTSLFCRDDRTGKNSFIGSGYTLMGGGPNQKYDVVIYPEKNAIIFLCISYNIVGEEPINEQCTLTELNKNIIITPGVEQTIEFNYNYTNKDANKVEKVVTSSTLIGAWESCYKMGMIKNFGLYNSVKQKLDNAAKQQAKGQIDAAANIRNAALNEIEAQHGKGIDKMCGGIMIEDLRANVR